MHRPASSYVRGGIRPVALQEKVRPSTASDRTRLVQHFGPDAKDVEHMSERYIDEQLPGAVQVPRCEDPRPRLNTTPCAAHTHPPPPPWLQTPPLLLTCLLSVAHYERNASFATCIYS